MYIKTMKSLKEIRKEYKLTQKQCAEILGISLRSYKYYENLNNFKKSIKYNYFIDILQKHFEITETKGVLSFSQIENICNEILSCYDIDYCYLFGSYAKGTATESSDVDLLISDCNALKFLEILEKLRENLKKQVDLLEIKQLNNNQQLLNEILTKGIKIYDKYKR